MIQHSLFEYQTIEVALPPDVVEMLISRHSQHLSLMPSDKGRKWRLTATSYVGSIRVGDHAFLIRPKVRLENLLAMMDIEITSEMWREEVVGLAHEPDLLVAMARLYCVACEDATRRGIRRSYRVEEERLISPRGRIDIRQIIRRPALQSPLACIYDEHTADVPINRILKAAMQAARRLPGIGPGWQRRFLKQLSELEDVSSRVGDISWVPKWSPAPMEKHLETAVRLACIILSSSSLKTEYGSTNANSFLLNMNDLFEKWVTRQLQIHCGGHQVVGQAAVSLGMGGSVPMNPDITFWSDREVVAVADCKYKLLKAGAGRSPDYYQALAYATALDLRESWLIYARWPGTVDASTVEVRNSDKILRVVGLDMSGPISAAKAELQASADEILRSHVLSVSV